MRALLFAFAIGRSSTAAAGPCAIQPLVAHAMTVDETPISPGAGVLVALTAASRWDAPPDSDLTKTAWKFIDGAAKTAPKVRIIAPGLAVFEPPAGTGSIQLHDGTRVVTRVKRTATATPELAAPTVAAVVHDLRASPAPRDAPRTSVRVRLAGARPQAAVAMIVFTADKTPVPMSWTSAFNYQGPKGELEIYHSTSRCETQPAGLVAPAMGSRVTVAWVDASGRIGARSKEVAVTTDYQGPPGPPTR